MNEYMLKAAGGNLLLGNLDNPNKMPFTGVLTYLGVPSDVAPHGSGGRKVMIPVQVGLKAADSLKGMPINLDPTMSDHNLEKVIGVIEDAWVGEVTAAGTPLNVKGYIFAKNFPNEAAAIKMSQGRLGFSYETSKTLLASGNFNGEEVAIAESLIFTGATILYKDSAAYQHTSIAASKLDENTAKIIGQQVLDIVAASVPKDPDGNRDDDTTTDPAKNPDWMDDVREGITKWPSNKEQQQQLIDAGVTQEAADEAYNAKHNLKANKEVYQMNEEQLKALMASIGGLTEAVKAVQTDVATVKAEVDGIKASREADEKAKADAEAKAKFDAEVKAAAEKMVEEAKAAGQQGQTPAPGTQVQAGAEPQRKSEQTLVGKFDQKPSEVAAGAENKVDVFASIDKSAAEKNLSATASMGQKLNAIWG